MSVSRPMCVFSLIFMLMIYLALNAIGGVDLSEYCSYYTEVYITGKIADKVYKNNQHQLHLKECNIYNSNSERKSKFTLL